MSKELKLIIDAEGIEKQILSLKDKFEEERIAEIIESL